MDEEQTKALGALAEQAFFDSISKATDPLRQAIRAIQMELIALRLATYQLAAMVAERSPDGAALLQSWIQRLILAADTFDLKDENNQALPAELEAEVRAEIRRKFEALSASIVATKG
jgi:hypothetical protein